MLLAADGRSDKDFAERLDIDRRVVAHCRVRFLAAGVNGLLQDATRPGRPRTARAAVKVQEIVRLTPEEAPATGVLAPGRSPGHKCHRCPHLAHYGLKPWRSNLLTLLAHWKLTHRVRSRLLLHSGPGWGTVAADDDGFRARQQPVAVRNLLSPAVGLKVDFDMALLVIASGLYPHTCTQDEGRPRLPRPH